MPRNQLRVLCFATLLLAGCSSEGTLGILTRAAEDPGQLMRSGRAFEVLGFAEGEACKRFFLGMIPWGDASLAIAVDRALYDKRGDALINVTVESSLLFSPPPYFLYTVSCNKVKGTMIKFQQ